MNRLRKQILSSLNASSKSIWELFLELDCGEDELFRELNQLYAEKVIQTGDKIQLIEKQDSSVQNNSRCTTCSGRNIVLNKQHEKTLVRFNALTETHNPADVKLEQLRITSKDAIRKIAFMEQRGDVRGNDILIVGDDDFISVGLALVGGANSIQVLEIDEKLNNTIRNISEKEGLDIAVREYDVQEPLPDALKGKFDVFVTNPPDSGKGMQLFVSRCVEGLKGAGSSGYADLTHQESLPKKWHEIQQDFLRMNLFPTDIIRQFTRYPEEDGYWEAEENERMRKKLSFPVQKPDTRWFTASLFRLELADQPNPLYPGKVTIGETFSI